MQTYFDRLVKSCESCTTSTCRTYAYSMFFLDSHVDIADLEAVLEFLKEQPLSRQQGCLTALKVWYNRVDENHELSGALAEPLMKVRGQRDKRKRKQQASPSELKNWVDYQDLKKATRCLREYVFKLRKSSLFSKQDYHKLQLAFIMTFMLDKTLRRDLATVTYDGTGPNTLDVRSHEITFTKYKTARFYGPQTYTLTRDQWKLFSWMRVQHRLRGIKDGHLLRNTYWRPLVPNALTSYLKVQCKRNMECCEGKNIGCTLLRKIVVSWVRRNDLTLDDRSKLAKKMMHSVSEQDLTYTKNLT